MQARRGIGEIERRVVFLVAFFATVFLAVFFAAAFFVDFLAVAFLPPPSCLFTVAHAMRSAVSVERPWAFSLS